MNKIFLHFKLNVKSILSRFYNINLMLEVLNVKWVSIFMNQNVWNVIIQRDITHLNLKVQFVKKLIPYL